MSREETGSLLSQIGELVEREFQARALNALVFDTDGQTVDQILARMRERISDPGLLTLTLLELAFRSIGPNSPVEVEVLKVGEDETGKDEVHLVRRVDESEGDDGHGAQLLFDDGVLRIRLSAADEPEGVKEP